MHTSIEQLLALRAGEPLDPQVAGHVAQCATCRAQLTSVTTLGDALRALPPLAAPDNWAAIADRLTRARARRTPPRALLLATAATLVVAVALMWWGARPASVPATAQQELAQAASADELTTLLARSAQLEQQLATLNARAPAVIRLGHEVDAARLQARLRALDAGHAQTLAEPSARDLDQLYWHERVRLLDSIINIERAELVQRDAAYYRSVPVSY